jgi:hypothetical protein
VVCFLRAFVWRRETLAQANTLSRTYAALLEALNRHRGKGQQKVTVEHVHVHPGGQAIVGAVTHPVGVGWRAKARSKPMDQQTREPLAIRLLPRCGARNRAGQPCQRAVARGKSRCTMHGGAPGSGAPKGERNGNYRHGRFTCEAIDEIRAIRGLLRRCRSTLAAL